MRLEVEAMRSGEVRALFASSYDGGHAEPARKGEGWKTGSGVVRFLEHGARARLQRGNGMASDRRGATIWVISVIAVIFGLMTLKEGGAVLFGSGEARAAAGNYVPFVLWFNFLAGFAYVAAGVGIWLERRWATGMALVIAAATALVFAAFGVHVLVGGAYELRTVVAMSLRTLVWVAIARVTLVGRRRLLAREY